MAMVCIHLLMVKVFLILFKYGLYVLDVTYPKPFLDSTRTMSRNQNWEALNSFLLNSKEEWKKRSSTLGSFGSSRTVPSRPRTWKFDNFPIPSSAVHAPSGKKSFDHSYRCRVLRGHPQRISDFWVGGSIGFQKSDITVPKYILHTKE